MYDCSIKSVLYIQKYIPDQGTEFWIVQTDSLLHKYNHDKELSMAISGTTSSMGTSLNRYTGTKQSTVTANSSSLNRGESTCATCGKTSSSSSNSRSNSSSSSCPTCGKTGSSSSAFYSPSSSIRSASCPTCGKSSSTTQSSGPKSYVSAAYLR